MAWVANERALLRPVRQPRGYYVALCRPYRPESIGCRFTYAADLEGIELGYKAEELMVYVCEKSGLRPDMDEGNYRRTLRHGKELTLGKKAAKKKKSQQTSAKK
ncbi:MAG: hypothetical protein JWM68_359 [Verrucomicrobiales bacterium]|nr:hypothetical protein [Verrucomicrobiales bacterium]